MIDLLEKEIHKLNEKNKKYYQTLKFLDKKSGDYDKILNKLKMVTKKLSDLTGLYNQYNSTPTFISKL